MDAHYIERGTLIAVGNIIAIKEVNQDGYTVEENLYRIVSITNHPAKMGRAYFTVHTTHINGRYLDLSLSKGELEEMVESGFVSIYNKS